MRNTPIESTSFTKPDTGDILVVGGYGDVGARVSEILAQQFPDRIRIGGRRGEVAQELANRIGHGSRGVALDIADPAAVAAALSDVATVVITLDDPKGIVLAAAVDRGLGYVDISADWQMIAAGRRLHEVAVTSGARAVLGIGLSPGVTNLMAASATNRVDRPSEIVVGILLSLYDEFGPQALEMMLEAASRPFPVPGRDPSRNVRPYTGPRPIWFGPEFGVRTARRFPFPDQFGYADTLGVDSAATVVALDPRWLDRVMAIAAKLGTLRLASRPSIRRLVASLLMRLRGDAGLAPVALSATATNGTSASTVLFQGVGESAATANAIAVAAARVGSINPGVWLPEQAFDPESFLKELATHAGTTVTWPRPDDRHVPTTQD
jgi:saccharopine dehydrogenase-like NADP-dependent oxidoreductase